MKTYLNERVGYTTFEINPDLKIEWHGGSDFYAYRKVNSEWNEWDVFSIMHVDNLKDAKEFVASWALDNVEEYIL